MREFDFQEKNHKMEHMHVLEQAQQYLCKFSKLAAFELKKIVEFLKKVVFYKTKNLAEAEVRVPGAWSIMVLCHPSFDVHVASASV